jgi:hypothetical protein
MIKALYYLTLIKINSSKDQIMELLIILSSIFYYKENLCF